MILQSNFLCKNVNASKLVNMCIWNVYGEISDKLEKQGERLIWTRSDEASNIEMESLNYADHLEIN